MGRFKSKKLLYKDIMRDLVPLKSKDEHNNMTLREIYCMRPDYAEYHYNKFSSRLSGLQKTIEKYIQRANNDQEAFDIFDQNNPILHYNHKGHIQWQGSDQQRLLKKCRRWHCPILLESQA